MSDTMTMHQSYAISGDYVAFPWFKEERIYMQEFANVEQLPDRWQQPVADMLDVLDFKRAYLMVDCAEVAGGHLHRRPGLHVDQNWSAPAGGHRDPVPSHNPPSHVPPGRHVAPGMHGGHTGYGKSQLLLLASQAVISDDAVSMLYPAPGAEAYVGGWSGEPGEGGDCSHIDVDGLSQVIMQSNRAYMLDSCWTLHRSIPLPASGKVWQRQVIRLNVEV